VSVKSNATVNAKSVQSVRNVKAALLRHRKIPVTHPPSKVRTQMHQLLKMHRLNAPSVFAARASLVLRKQMKMGRQRQLQSPQLRQRPLRLSKRPTHQQLNKLLSV
jgi:hypothetical protein